MRAASAPGTADKFLTAATKEFEAGLIDQPLWKRAMDQCGGDRTAAGQAYLRARATALRVTKRDKRQERSARRARAMNELVTPADPRSASPVSESASKPAGALRSRGLRPKRGQVMWVGGALASLFVAALFVTLRSETGAAQQKDPAKPASAASGPTRIASAGSIAPRNAKADGAADAKANAQAHEALSGEDFAAKLQGLKSAGNWNMVVLYAVEWIRKQPENPEAWKELSSGYARLRQYREALDAATRVVQLSPDDATAWQTLGQLNVVLQQPVDALAAFEQALARNERDAPSMVQTGIINTQLGRFADAKLAFAKALALNSQDVEALCGAASLAQREGRPKDAEALTRQVATLDNRCRDASPGESVRVAAGAKSRTAASVVR
ncbi:MAG TPA: tetratricopeptide repeat protein [Casimicrobiaceae bacterium]|nr:tetratricopeptide repeat protein [Casimicrobiaceae bacterium]